MCKSREEFRVGCDLESEPLRVIDGREKAFHTMKKISEGRLEIQNRTPSISFSPSDCFLLRPDVCDVAEDEAGGRDGRQGDL